jgi:tetratricopeptide (TPR) repeat protein
MGEIRLGQFGDPSEAMRCFEQALSIDAKQQGALAGLARALESQDKPREAAALWERLLAQQQSPDRAASLVSLAKLLAGPLQQSERAVECYTRALRDDPRNHEAVDALASVATERQQWPLLADLYQRRFQLVAGAARRTAVAIEAGHLQLERLDDLDAAHAWFTRAVELSPEDSSVQFAFAELARRRNDDDALIASLTRLIELAGESSPLAIVLEAANLHAERADHEQALALLELAQRRNPDDPIVLEALSDALASLGRYEELASVLERRASLAANDPEACAAALLELGRLQLSQLQDTDSASDAFERAFDTHPAAPGVAENLERLYRKSESWEPLRAMLERAAIDAEPEDRCGFHCSLGELLRERFGEPDASGRAFEAALALAPDAPRALKGLEDLARDSGDPDALVRALSAEAAIARQPERVCELSLELLRICEQRGQLDEALHWAERLLEASPQEVEALERVAELQERLEHDSDLERTLGRLDEVLRGPEQAQVRRRIAEFHRERGDVETALLYWEGALESQPDDLVSLKALRSQYAARDRAEDLAAVLRKLAEVTADSEQIGHLTQLSLLLEEELSDLDGAIVVSWRIVKSADCPVEVSERLESLLERAGRFEELAQQLQERRRPLPDQSEEAIAIDLRRAQLLLDPLCQYEEAADAFGSVRERAVHLQEAALGLERALRASNDTERLARLLGELAETESNPEKSDKLRLEQAVLHEEELDQVDAARAAYAQLATSGANPDAATEAGRRLESLLERCADWAALRDYLESRIDHVPAESALALRERLASLCRERMSDLDGAASHLEEAARLRPERAEAWQRLSTLYAELDRPDDLLRVTEFELETFPDVERKTQLHARAATMWARSNVEDRATEHYEKLLELETGHREATEYLVDRYQRLGRPRDVVQLLETRLDAVSLGIGVDPEVARSPEAGTEAAGAGLRTSLRLRLASVLREELDDHAAAIDVLAPSLIEEGPTGPACLPLADLYREAGRNQELIELCGRAERACEAPAEQALWLLRLGDALRDEGEDSRAVDAYRRALATTPGNREIVDALCELYRRTDRPAPLAELLEDKLETEDRSEEVPIRMELARLLEDELGRGADALSHLQRVIGLESGHSAAFDHALRLARRLEQHEDQLQLIDARLELRLPVADRASLLERRADLLAGPIEASEHAITTYREALALDPRRSSTRSSLRQLLERLGRWSAVLDCLYVDAGAATSDERGAIFERAVEIAGEKIGPDAALPWLERLRVERPQDPAVVARIADVHRLAGRFESVLRALEDELTLSSSPERQRDLHVGRARILDRDMEAPRRAIAALEAARALAPEDPEILRKLDELYERTGHARERVEIVEARLACGAGEPLALHRSAAQLCSQQLADHQRAVPHLLQAVALHAAIRPSSEQTPTAASDPHLELLRELADALKTTGDISGWARASETELEMLAPAHDDAELATDTTLRCAELRRDLAWAYLHELCDRSAALGHLRGVLKSGDGPTAPLPPDDLERLELALLDLLRSESNWVELEQQLGTRLQTSSGCAEEWLELARLRDEKLHSPRAALVAYRKALQGCPSSLPAIRETRSLAACLRDWPEVRRALELELALPDSASGAERGTLLRELGEVCWRRLNSNEAACSAYEDALETDPNDLAALRSLQQLREKREDWEVAIGLFEREAELLADSDPDACQQAWVAAARLTRDHTLEPRLALRAYEQAAAISEIAPEDRLSQAELYRTVGSHELFVDVYASWCDDPVARASSSDHLVLVHALSDLGRSLEALERVRKAIDVDDRDAEAWDAMARLLESSGETLQAAGALVHAADLYEGREAAVRRVDAALLLEPSDLPRACDLLARAVEADAGWPVAHAHLARTAMQLEDWQVAEAAAARSLDLAAAVPGEGPATEIQLATALAGGVAARQLDRLDAAASFFRVALEVEPSHREALEAQSQVLFERGELSGSRRALEAHLALDGAQAGRSSRLAMLATIFELEGDAETALARFEEALQCDARDTTAHAGIARLHEKAERISEAVEALEQWADTAGADGDRSGRAARLLHAGELEVGQERIDDAERHLRGAIAADPTSARAWVLLAEILADSERTDELLRLAPEALTNEEVSALPDAVARLALLYARALERRNDPTMAREAYAEVLRVDPRCIEAALALGRLLRECGAWSQAADVLRAFRDDHPEPNHRELAEVHYKLARLLAGPLEDVPGAIECYERALEIAPAHPKAREPLASLLAHLPERWQDAVRHHALLLQRDPTRSASLRSLQQIAERRGQEEASLFGLAILRALGSASPSERTRAPETLSPPIRGAQELQDPIWDVARQVAETSAKLLEQVLDGPTDGEPPTSPAAADDFPTVLRELERSLCPPALAALGSGEISEVLCTIANAAAGEEFARAVDADDSRTELATAVEYAIGRRTRRKLRRILDGTSPELIRTIDFETWLASVRGLAAARALERSDATLRSALLQLSMTPEEAAETEETDDLSARIAGAGKACNLLRQLEAAWCSELAHG